jgi:hypothetical protein
VLQKNEKALQSFTNTLAYLTLKTTKLECLSMDILFKPCVISASTGTTKIWKSFTNPLAYLTRMGNKLDCLSIARLFNPWVISVSTVNVPAYCDVAVSALWRENMNKGVRG